MPNSGPLLDRRSFLWRFGGGLGGIALAHLLSRELARGNTSPPVFAEGTHHRPKAKRVIQLFMNGGASQMDLFDYKPELIRRRGETFDPGQGKRVEAATSEPGKILGPVFPFRQHGQCGRWVSDVLPNLARCVDDLAFVMNMESRTNVHGPGSYFMNTGFLLPGFPSMGAWLSYALGNENDNLPTFVVLPDSRGLPYNQKGNFTAGFLPASHQGTILHAAANPPLRDLQPADEALSEYADAAGFDLLQRFNKSHLEAHADDGMLQARIQSYELAAKMQLAAPEAFNLDAETAATRKLYGLGQPATDDFGRRCLLARRLIERGVRFVQVWSGAGGPTGNWDNHASIARELPPMAAATDQPTAALLQDLKARGLWDDTLVLWNTEFGRMPFSQGGEGRDHNGGTFVSWLAGAGVKGGVSHGQSDDWSWKAVDPATVYDFHATVLHLLGIDHERLTFRYNGAERRLTDVHGEVLRDLVDGA